MKIKKITIVILIGFSLLFVSCEGTTYCDNETKITIPAFVRIPDNIEINGGFFFYLVGKYANQSNEEIDKSFRTDVIFPICNWYDAIEVQLDSIIINKRYQILPLNPFAEHSWYIKENKKYNIPEIKIKTSAMVPLEITPPQMYQSSNIPINLIWSKPDSTIKTDVFIILSKNNITSKDSTNMWIIPTEDDGNYSITDEYLKEFLSGDTLKITIARTWGHIDSLNSKYYLFAHTFYNNFFVILYK